MPGSERKVTVIGAGPAGIAAAQQLIREGIKEVMVFEKERIGGLIHQANEIENFPGFVGEEGRDVVKKFEQIISEYGIDIRREEVRKIKKTENCFLLKLEDGLEKATSVIVATGTEARKLGFVGEKTHPQWSDYSGEKVVIVGGGDATYDYALRVEKLGGEVTILRRSEPKALPVLVNRAKEREVKEVEGKVQNISRTKKGFLIECKKKRMGCDEVITAIGRDPSYPKLPFELDLEEVEFPTGTTSIEGLYVIGSTVLGTYRQTSLAWGMGIASGMKEADRIQRNRKV